MMVMCSNAKEKKGRTDIIYRICLLPLLTEGSMVSVRPVRTEAHITRNPYASGNLKSTNNQIEPQQKEWRTRMKHHEVNAQLLEEAFRYVENMEKHVLMGREVGPEEEAAEDVHKSVSTNNSRNGSAASARSKSEIIGRRLSSVQSTYRTSRTKGNGGKALLRKRAIPSIQQQRPSNQVCLPKIEADPFSFNLFLLFMNFLLLCVYNRRFLR